MSTFAPQSDATPGSAPRKQPNYGAARRHSSQRAIDITGTRYGRLVALSLVERRGLNCEQWLHCRCDCGAERVVPRTSLLQGYTRSCGCLRREATAQRNRERAVAA